MPVPSFQDFLPFSLLFLFATSTSKFSFGAKLFLVLRVQHVDRLVLNVETPAPHSASAFSTSSHAQP